MDYIDNYKKNYRVAYERDFCTPRDKKISNEFFQKAKEDVQWGKDNGFIKDMSMQDYIESMCKYGKITDKVRKAVIEAKHIPIQLLADYYGLHQSTISKIRREHKYSHLEVSE